MIEFDEIRKKYENLSNIHSVITLKHSNHIPKDIYTIVRENLSNSKFAGNNSLKFFLRKNNKFLHISSSTSSTLSISPINYYIIYNSKSDVNISTIIESYKTSIIINDIFKINKKFNIYVLMSDNKRYLPAVHSHMIEPDNINGGFTSSNTEKIFITRGEEFSKVIMHELLHHSYIDNHNWDESNIDRLKRHFKISNDTQLHPNEAVIELYATMLKLYFVSLRFKVPFQLLYEKELKYSIIQYFKIINKQGHMNPTKTWFETTNSYCYIIFKTILLKNHYKLKNKFYNNTDYITDFILSNRIALNSNLHIKFNNSLKIMLYSNY
jgi:hypothetical protein